MKKITLFYTGFSIYFFKRVKNITPKIDEKQVKMIAKKPKNVV